jgi:hypothetical protein
MSGARRISRKNPNFLTETSYQEKAIKTQQYLAQFLL